MPLFDDGASAQHPQLDEDTPNPDADTDYAALFSTGADLFGDVLGFAGQYTGGLAAQEQAKLSAAAQANKSRANKELLTLGLIGAGSLLVVLLVARKKGAL